MGIDRIMNDEARKGMDKVLIGIYIEPEVAKILDTLYKRGGRGTKSEIANEALKKLFEEKGLLPQNG